MTDPTPDPTPDPTDPSPTPRYSYPGSSPTSPSVPSVPSVPSAPAGVGLSDEGDASPAGRPGGRRTGLVVGGIVAALVLGGGAVFAVQQLSGGGSQPADVLPGDAYGYVRLDIDPSAGQKIAAVRFLDKLPQIRDTLGGDDPRKKLWDLVAQDAGDDCIAALSYDKDIAPWLGDRAGAAVRPGGTGEAPNVALAVQVTDEAKAKEVLGKLFACDKDGADIETKDGYALVMPPGTGKATMAAIAKGTLAANSTFSGDMSALGEQGVLSAWFDMTNGAKELQDLGAGALGMSSTTAVGAQGRVAAALRFDPSYVELAGVVRGAKAVNAAPGDGSQLLNLPDDTAAALHVSGADQAIDAAWPTLSDQIEGLSGVTGGDVIAEIEQELDVSLPDDLKVLLGRSFTLSVPQQDLRTADSFVVGGKIVSSNGARAGALVDRIDQAMGGILTHTLDAGTVYLATDPAYVDTLKAGGSLGDTDTFKAALGDVSRANGVLFVDLDRIESAYLSDLEGDTKSVVESLRAVGASTQVTGDGEAAFSLRVVSN
ncbi:MAG TPA: DUF3352 domain-containing protein [Humibacillus sp.]|nr:DUF3352 domain-containing protein [Humibacillus sp.]